MLHERGRIISFIHLSHAQQVIPCDTCPSANHPTDQTAMRPPGLRRSFNQGLGKHFRRALTQEAISNGSADEA